MVDIKFENLKPSDNEDIKRLVESFNDLCEGERYHIAQAAMTHVLVQNLLQVPLEDSAASMAALIGNLLHQADCGARREDAKKHAELHPILSALAETALRFFPKEIAEAYRAKQGLFMN